MKKKYIKNFESSQHLKKFEFNYKICEIFRMISALKRLVANNDNSTNINSQNSGQNANNLSPNGSSTNSNNSNSGAIASNLATTTSLLNNGMQMISQSLQKKFSKGVNYNSKDKRKKLRFIRI